MSENYIPSLEELREVRKIVDNTKQNVEDVLEKNNISQERVVAVGSSAKGTFLSGDHDIDIYVVSKEPVPLRLIIINNS